MIEYLSKRGNEIRLLFSNQFERDTFYKGLVKMEGIVEIIRKENRNSLKIRYEPNTFASYLFEHLGTTKKERLSLEDLHFYTSPLIRHPATKFLYSLLIFGKKLGPIHFALCGMLITPFLKSKL